MKQGQSDQTDQADIPVDREQALTHLLRVRPRHLRIRQSEGTNQNSCFEKAVFFMTASSRDQKQTLYHKSLAFKLT